MLNTIIVNVVMPSRMILSVIMLSVFMVSVVMLSVFMLSVVMLSVVMLSVVMLNVGAPKNILLIFVRKVLKRGPDNNCPTRQVSENHAPLMFNYNFITLLQFDVHKC
jgi:hypothetical protein